jgi:glycosyltransferase involved in cell wall biosynthesis
MMKQKILFPFVGDSVGGSHRSAITLMTELQSREIDILAVIHNQYEPLEKLFLQNNIPYKFHPVKKLAGQSPNFFSIFWLIAINFIPLIIFLYKHKPTIVHGNDLRINLTWGIPTKAYNAIFIWHQRTVLSKSRFWHLIKLLSSHCVSISNYVFLSLPSSINKKNKSMIYNPVALKDIPEDSSFNIRNKLGFKQDVKILVYAGRLVPSKEIDTLIFTLKDLFDRGIRAELLLVGKSEDQYQKHLESMGVNLGVANHIHFIGYVSNPEHFIAMGDFIISPGPFEGLGRLSIEGMLYKTLVLASDSGAHKEIIQSGQNGILFPVTDHSSLAKKIEYFVNNTDERTKIIRDAYNSSKEKFSVEHHCDQIQKIYNNDPRN